MATKVLTGNDALTAAAAGQFGSEAQKIAVTPQSVPVTVNASRSLSTPTQNPQVPITGSQISQNIESQFQNAGQYQPILSRFNQAQQATAQQYGQYGQYLTNLYGQNIDYQKLQNNVEQQGELEARRGFATNVAALTNLQRQGDQRVKALTDQANQALMANNAQGAAALSNLAVQEQTAITNARTQFLTQYFGAQQEARAQAAFQTPEQAAVLKLAQDYPGAGISPGDDLATVQNKIFNSPLYQANLGKVYQDIASAQATAQAQLMSGQASLLGAQAQGVSAQAATKSAAAAQAQASAAQQMASAQSGLLGAQTTQTRFLNEMLQGTGGGGAQAQNDVNALLSGTLTPQGLQDKYSNFPGGLGGAISSSILTQAQQQGYNAQQGYLTGVGQQSQAQVLNSGNPATMFGLGVTNAFNWAKDKLLGSGPQIGDIQNVSGTNYKFNGTSWVKQ